MPYFDLAVSAQVKAGEPPGDALPNTEIFRRLASAMGFDEPELHESDADLIAAVLRQTGIGLDFAALAEAGTVPWSPQPVVQFADLRFPTPSGRIELASARAEADGLPRVPVPHADPRPPDGMLRLLSPASPWSLNTTFTVDAKVSRFAGPAAVGLHPADADALGVCDGDDVALENATGRLVLRATVSDDVPRGVALSPKGRWSKREPGGATVNALNPGTKADMGESSAVHGVEVRVVALGG